MRMITLISAEKYFVWQSEVCVDLNCGGFSYGEGDRNEELCRFKTKCRHFMEGFETPARLAKACCRPAASCYETATLLVDWAANVHNSHRP
jgi:hypothetical protein